MTLFEKKPESLWEKVTELDPFSSKRKNKNQLLDKSAGLSPFTGMTKEKLDRFDKCGRIFLKCNHVAKS